MNGARTLRVARAASALTIVLGCLVLVGWFFDIDDLKSVIPGLVTMKVNTAASFVLAGVSLWLQIGHHSGRTKVRIARLCAMVVAAVGFLTLTEYLFGADLGIDRLLLVRTAEGGTSSSARMAPNTATSLVLLGAALVLLSGGNRAKLVARGLAAGVLLIAFVTSAGYALSVVPLYSLGGHTAMAISSAVGFVVLSIGLIVSLSRGPELRFVDWPLRGKMAALLVVASVAPLSVAAFRETRAAAKHLMETTSALLGARGDHIVGEIDGFNRGYRQSVQHLARAVVAVGCCSDFEGGPTETVRAILATRPANDTEVRGSAILDSTGKIRFATDVRTEGLDLSYHSYVRAALRGGAIISDVHVAGTEAGERAMIAYVAPVRGSNGALEGLAVIWIRAEALWNLMKMSNELAGARSFAVMFDDQGIRIAHTYSDEIVFHPGGSLTQATIDAAVAERRFGERTRTLLDDVRAFPEQFERALASVPDVAVFHGFAPVNQAWNYGVARRLATVSWTLFYMIPEAALSVQIARSTRDRTLFAGLVIAFALLTGAAFAAVIVNPIRALSLATERLAGGEPNARVATPSADEIGKLAASFNRMADRIEAQSASLQQTNQALDERVRQRTADLAASEQSLTITLNSIGDGVIACDTQARVQRMNPVAERLTGWRFSEAATKPLAEVFRILNEDTKVAMESPVARVLREGAVVGLANHTVLVARNGTEVAIADSGAPIRDAHGDVVGVVLVFRDATVERIAERALRESEARKTAVLDSAFDAIVWMDHAGLLVEFNPAAEKLFGYRRGDVMGKAMSDLLVPPLHRDAHLRGVARYLQTGVGPILGKVVELPAMRADGTVFSAEVAINRVRDQNPPLFTAFVRDVSERRQAQERLRQNEERLRDVITGAGAGFYERAADYSSGQFSERFAEILGYAPEEVPNYPELVPWFAERLDSEDRLAGGRRQDDFQAGRVDRFEDDLRIRAKDGTWRWIRILTAHVRRDEAGRPTHVAGLIFDITERKQIEEALRASQERFRALVEASAQIVWTTDANGAIVEDSPSWRAVTGQTFEDLRSASRRREAIHPEDRDRVIVAWARAAEMREQFVEEYRLRHASGEWRWTSLRAVPLLNSRAEVREWVGMNIDVTDQRKSQMEREDLLQQLRTLNSELELRVESRTRDLSAALKEREVLLQEVHHRVKNNLQVISSLINMQMRQMTDVPAKNALDECKSRVAAIALIHEKLYQSKDYASVPFSDYARSLSANVFHATGISPSNIELAVDIETVSLAVDKAIPCGLILNELITNALKHAFPADRSGTVTVELRRREEQIILAVRDDGIGMPTGFDPAKSNSLGLQLVTTLVEQLDGQLEIVRNAGTQFRVTFALEVKS